MLALIDGDIIAYQAVSAATKEIDWQDGEGPNTVADIAGAIDSACRLVEEWTRLAGCGRQAVMFSGRTGANFRKVIDPIRYKATRKDKPAGYWQIVDAVEARFKCYRIEGLEADDLLGIAGTDLARWGHSVIVSIDKDLETVPAFVFNPSKDRRPRRVSTAQADYRWMTQTLTGDSCDGYPGCPQIGPVKATKIFAESGLYLDSMWRAVVKTFEAAGLTEADALLQARLARILRYTDYDRDNKEIRLWHLTKPTTFPLSRTWPSPAPSTSASSPEEASTAVSTSPPPSKTGAASRSRSTGRRSKTPRAST